MSIQNNEQINNALLTVEIFQFLNLKIRIEYDAFETKFTERFRANAAVRTYVPS